MEETARADSISRAVTNDRSTAAAEDDDEDDADDPQVLQFKTRLSQLARCAICSELFTGLRLLPTCTHAFCLECINNIMTRSPDNKPPSCASCQRPFRVPSERLVHLPTAGYFDDLLFGDVPSCWPVVSESDVGPVGCDWCQTGEVSSATMCCRQCHQFLCDRCLHGHARGKLTRNHRIDRLDVILLQRNKDRDRGHRQRDPQQRVRPLHQHITQLNNAANEAESGLRQHVKTSDEIRQHVSECYDGLIQLMTAGRQRVFDEIEAGNIEASRRLTTLRCFVRYLEKFQSEKDDQQINAVCAKLVQHGRLTEITDATLQTTVVGFTPFDFRRLVPDDVIGRLTTAAEVTPAVERSTTDDVCSTWEDQYNQLKQMTAERDKLTGHLTEAVEKWRTLEQENTAINQQLQVSQKHNEQLEISQQELTDLLMVATEQRDSLTANVVHLQNANSDLNGRVEQLRTNLGTLQTRCKTQFRQLAEFRERDEIQLAKINELRSVIADIGKRPAELASANRELRDLLEKSTGDVKRAHEELQKRRLEESKLQRQMKISIHKEAELGQQVERQKRRLMDVEQMLSTSDDIGRLLLKKLHDKWNLITNKTVE